MASIFPSDWTYSTADDGPQQFTIGTVMVANVAGTITHFRVRVLPAENSGTWTLIIYGPTGSGAVSQTYSHTQVGAAQWLEVALTTPYAVTAGQKFLVAKHCNDAAYPAAGGYFNTARTSTDGSLTAPATATVTTAYFDSIAGNGRYNYGNSPGNRPNGSFNGGGYGVDVVFSPTSSGTTFDAAGTVAAVSTVSGSATVAVANPTVTAGLPRPVVNGQGVGLDVTATPPPSGTITGYSWAIQSGGGSLTGATTATPTYTAPASGTGTAVIRATVTGSTGGTATADVTVGYAANIVAAENQLAGTPRTTWDLPTAGLVLAGIDTLQGFADGFTRDKTQTVNFKIAQSDGAGWSAQVYRLGWYGGDGARYMGTPTTADVATSQAQPTPGDADTVTTKLSADCSNWSVTATWTPPSWAPSGVYVLRLNRTGGGASHAMFILRDDARTADLMLMPSDSTWQAYNAFGGMGANLYAGNSLYYGTAVDQYNSDCARFVSYNRPIINRGSVHGGYGAVQWSNFFTGEYPMVRFLERNGADVKYYGCIDAMGDPTGTKLAGKVSAAMMVGHNEYWSDNMRAGWEAARAAGVSLFTCASNEVFWRTIGDQTDSDGRPRRIECYKSTIAGRSSTGRTQWTGTWRDPDGAGKGGDNPENSLTGTIFVVNGPDLHSIVVPFTGGYSAQPIWRDTTAGALSSGTWTSPSQILGFEWDTYGPAGTNGTGGNYLADPHPAARYCSNVTYSVSGPLLVDAGDVYGSGTATHRLVAFPGEQGQLCFGTGTINWSLGVDNANTYQGIGSDNTSTVIQQATLNVLTDMGVDFATVMSGMTDPIPVEWYETHDAAGTVAASSGATGSAAARRVASGAVAAVLAVTGAATARLPASGQVAASSAVSTVATARLAASGSVTATSAVAGSANIVGGPQTYPATGAVAASSSITGAATARLRASGTVAAVSTASGAATIVSGPATYPAAGTVAATSAVTGSATAILRASGAVAAESAVTGRAVISGTERDVTIAVGAPTRHALTVAAPDGHPLTIGTPRS